MPRRLSERRGNQPAVTKQRTPRGENRSITDPSSVDRSRHSFKAHRNEHWGKSQVEGRKKGREVKVDFEPFYQQAKFLVSKAPIAVAIAGARGGKTTAGAARFFDKAIEQPNYSRRAQVQGIPYKLVAGTYTDSATQRVVRTAFEQICPNELKIGSYHGTKRLRKIRGRYGETWIYFLSARHPESWLGMDLNGVWLDEAAVLTEEMFDEAQTRVANQRGFLQLTSTPRGPNWLKKRVYDIWRQGSDAIDVSSWRTIDNPYFPKEELARKKAILPERYYKRTFEATFDSFEGQVYEDFIQAIHVLPSQDYSFLVPGRETPVGKGKRVIKFDRVVAGVDWGFSTEHPGCIVVFGITPSGRWYLVEESYASMVPIFAEQPHDSWVKRAIYLKVKWGIENFYCDSAEPEHIYTFLQHKLPAEPADKAVDPGIQRVAEVLKVDEHSGEPGMYMLNTCTNSIDEHQFYHWKDNKPAKVQDHTCDATRYVIFTYKKTGGFSREVGYVPIRDSRKRYVPKRRVAI